MEFVIIYWVRSDMEKTIREEREKHLSPEMPEIKNVLDAVTSQNTLLGNMKVELDDYKNQLQLQKGIIDDFQRENSVLKKKMQGITDSDDDTLDLTNSRGQSRK